MNLSLSLPNYQRTRAKELMGCTKPETKTILIARFGMLECGKNFKGTINTHCDGCRIVDDEVHRLNICPKYRELNYLSCDDKVDFTLVYADRTEVIKNIACKITKVWNTHNAHGTMNKE